MIESSQMTAAEAPLRYGMVGGGEGAFIGDVHRKAIALDGQAKLVCGCFSTDPQNTLRTGISLGLEQQRLYATYQEMAVEEGKKDNKIDFVVIVTPNNTIQSPKPSWKTRSTLSVINRLPSPQLRPRSSRSLPTGTPSLSASPIHTRDIPLPSTFA